MKEQVRDEKRRMKRSVEYRMDEVMKNSDNLMFSKQAVEKYTHAMKHFKVQQLTRGSI